MKFNKFGKALLMGALSVGTILSVTSCIQSYSVGYLYVTGTTTAGSSGNGIISGFKIDHNTGKLSSVHGLPIGSGGSNPVRAILASGSKYVYVLNRGTNSAGNGNCTSTDPCKNSNISLFAVGANGILSFQQQFYTQGINPYRLIADSTSSYLYVLDHDAPDSTSLPGVTLPASGTNSCKAALGGTATACGDITVFSIDQTTGRLSAIQNKQVTPLAYFPVPANTVDFVYSSNFLITLFGPQSTNFPYSGGTSVYPYAISNGQLTISQNGIQPLSITQGTAIVPAGSNVYIMDNEPVTTSFNGNTVAAASQMLPYTIGTGGALQSQVNGAVPDDPTLANPVWAIQESKGKYLYVANIGNNVQGANAASGISAYFITTSPAFNLSFASGQPYGSNSGPQCIIEDPSNQFIYTANAYDSTVSGRYLDPNTGELRPLTKGPSSYSLEGPATWCFVSGRTN